MHEPRVVSLATALATVDAGVELPCVPVMGAKRHGARPPKLAPRRRGPSAG